MFTNRAMLTALALFVATPAMARPAITTLEVDNDHYEAVTVEIDDRVVGTVAARGSRAFTVPPGRHEVEVTTSDGRRLVDTYVRLHRGEHEEIEVEALKRLALLTNPSKLDLRVRVEGRTYELDAGKRLELAVEDRYVNIDVEAKAFGTWFDIGEERIRLGDRDRTQVAVGANSDLGFLKVDNDGRTDAVLVIDGRRQGLVRAGGVFALSLSAGKHHVALEVDGRIVDSQTVRLGDLEAERIYLKTPTHGMAVVHNSHHRDIVVVGDRGRRYHVDAGESLTFERLSAGSYDLVAYSEGGAWLDSITLNVEIGEREVWTVQVHDRRGHREDRRHQRNDRDDGYVDGGSGDRDGDGDSGREDRRSDRERNDRDREERRSRR